MSGQLLLLGAAAPPGPHLRVRFRFADGDPELRFVDQRTFGGLQVSPGGAELPGEIAHIARDPFDPLFVDEACVAALRRRRTGVKRALLDQTLISGVGNIYADEALWRARLHGSDRPTRSTRLRARELVGHVTDVMREALGAGGTSFDALYVNVNGESGYFDRSLAAYGREDEPCGRCGAPIRREPFMNRSSYSCPKCQPRPRTARAGHGPPGVTTVRSRAAASAPRSGRVAGQVGGGEVEPTDRPTSPTSTNSDVAHALGRAEPEPVIEDRAQRGPPADVEPPAPSDGDGIAEQLGREAGGIGPARLPDAGAKLADSTPPVGRDVAGRRRERVEPAPRLARTAGWRRGSGRR